MIRKVLLFPFTLIYGLVVSLRNLLFDVGVFRSQHFSKPLIVVGNLSTGGTGKSPMVRLLATHLKSSMHTVILSRGYGRRSSGVVFAEDTTGSPSLIGDEPAMYLNTLKGVDVVCSGNRRQGVFAIIDRYTDAGVILMDDGYQHRWVNPGLKILLTSFQQPFFNDMLLPSGNLREFKSGSRRADIIVVTKCPENISKAEMDSIRARIAPADGQHLFFAGIRYAKLVHHSEAGIFSDDNLASVHILMVTGIADPAPMEHYLRSVAADVTVMSFRDHHTFSEKDIRSIVERFSSITEENKMVVTSEKDIVRLKESGLTARVDKVYCLPIQPVITDEKKFLALIDEYSETGS